jgi:Flp pilus assembly protein TadG
MCKGNKDAGQALVLVALGMVVILGFLGLGLDLGYLRSLKRQVQKAADAAALAASVELTYCGGTNSCSALTTAAQDALTENGFTSSTLVTNCGTSSSSLTITVNNPPCYLGAADPHHGNTHYVEVVVSQVEPLMFAQVFGGKTATMSARSEAALGSGNNCIYALDPSDSATITSDLLASINSQCGIVDESSSSTALSCGWFSSITGSQIGVVGGYSAFLCTISPNPKTHISTPSPADPLAYLPVPTVGSCGTSTASPYTGYNGSSAGLVLSGTATLNPGVYCGGIEINYGANVTFNSGTYILTSATSAGGTSYGLTANIGALATGNGVTFYNTVTSGKTSGPIQFNYSSFAAGNGINFTAPTNGTYEGILFFQDPANSTSAQIIGSSSFNTILQGAYYFPKAKVVFALDGPIKYNILDAYQIEFAALTFAGSNFNTSGFFNDYSTLANGSPVKGTGGVLVE